MADSDEERRLWFRREVLPLEPQLRAQARKFCRRGNADIEDLIQETLARIIGYAEWRHIDNVAAFAARTLRNTAIDSARRQTVVQIDAIADIERIDAENPEPTPERAVIARDELRLLRELIATLPTQCRRVFTLQKVYGLSNGEIAVRLGISVSTVEKHLVKGLRLCSEGLGRTPPRVKKDEIGSAWSVGRKQRG